MLTREHWVGVPELTTGERSGLFAMGDAFYGFDLRVGEPLGGYRPPRDAVRASAATPRSGGGPGGGWLPGFASALHRDARAR